MSESIETSLKPTFWSKCILAHYHVPYFNMLHVFHSSWKWNSLRADPKFFWFFMLNPLGVFSLSIWWLWLRWECSESRNQLWPERASVEWMGRVNRTNEDTGKKKKWIKWGFQKWFYNTIFISVESHYRTFWNEMLKKKRWAGKKEMVAIGTEERVGYFRRWEVQQGEIIGWSGRRRR